MTKRKPPEELLPLMTVSVRGVVYASVKEVALHFKVSESNVRAMLHRGREDYIGLGEGKSPRRRVPHWKPQAVTVGPRTFPSQRALCEWLGVNTGYYHSMRKRGQLDRVLKRVMQRTAEEEARALKSLDKRMSEGIERRHYGG